MFEALVTVLFIWLFWKVLKLIFSIAWGLAKLVAIVVCIFAFPGLVLGLVSAAGLLLLIPVGILALVWGLLKACG